MSDAIVHYDNVSGLEDELYVQLDDPSNTALAVTEGTGGKLRRYTVSSDLLEEAEVPPGTWNATIRRGDVDDPQDSDEIVGVQQIQWSGNMIATNQSGGGVLFAVVGAVAVSPDEYYEIVQGESKLLLFIVGVKGRFAQAVPDEITVKLRDTKKVTQTVVNASITRIAQELDAQMFRAAITAEQTAALFPGLIQVEISIDNQKTVLTHSLKLVEAIEE